SERRPAVGLMLALFAIVRCSFRRRRGVGLDAATLLPSSAGRGCPFPGAWQATVCVGVLESVENCRGSVAVAGRRADRSGNRRACADRRFIFRYPARAKGSQMNIRHTPASVAAPFGPYSHAVEVPEGSRLLYISGEVGVLPDGTVPDTVEAQAEACWRNIIAILADAGMGVGDLGKITTYLVRPEDGAPAGAGRGKNFGDARPGSATIIVKALVMPEWLIEIEAVAAAKA